MYRDETRENDVKSISQQLLEGLQIMHKKGFTHRDLKPLVNLPFISPLFIRVSYSAI
jgi:serine/threonine protein kinase